MKGPCFFFAMIFTSLLFGQITGSVNYPEEGISFTIPQQWIGEELDEVFVMASNQEAGIIAMLFHPAKTKDKLIEQMQQGLHDELINLYPVGGISSTALNRVEGIYQGTLQGQAVKGKSVALINPHGQGIVIFSLINDNLYAARTDELANEVAASVSFSPSIATNSNLGLNPDFNAQQVRQYLANKHLKYVENYNSDTPGGGGYSINKEINLCPNGTFTFYGSSYLNVSSPNHDPYLKAGQGHGTYEFIDDRGEVYLQLNYTDGHYESLQVTYEESRTFLNGARYYVLDEVECY
ncbi:MAG: hypothetical protein AAFZ63_25170 [Bacteroidota bacterium]